MNDNEFNALVSLLEDDDKDIRRHVEARLREMGIEIVPRLREYMEATTDTKLQGRIEDVIVEMQSQLHITDLQAWFSDENPEKDMLKAWFSVSKYLYPALDFELIRKEITRLASRTWLEIKYGTTAPEKLIIINRMFFRKEMYRPSRKGVTEPECYFVNNVLERRRGVPLSLCLLYAIVCRELEIDIRLILLPSGYAVLYYHDNRNEVFVDVFNKGAFFSRSDLRRFLKENDIEDSPTFYLPAEPNAVILALLDTLIEVYDHEEDSDNAQLIRTLREAVA